MGKGKQADKAAIRGEDLAYLGEKLCRLVQLCEENETHKRQLRGDLERLDDAENFLRGDIEGILNTLAGGDLAKIRLVAASWRGRDLDERVAARGEAQALAADADAAELDALESCYGSIVTP